MTLDELIDKLEEKFGDKLKNKTDFRGETSFTIDREDIVEICRFCRDDLDFDYLIDITGTDHYDVEPRFEAVYELYGLPHGNHLRFKVFTPEDDPVIPSITALWPTANWHEREAYDMVGIKFTDHPDLRRILMWEGYPYFPLRRDFPLEGLDSDVEQVAFTSQAPLAGGPFVTPPSEGIVRDREPRARHPEPLVPDEDQEPSK